MNLVRKWFTNNNIKKQGWISNGVKEGTHYLYYQSGQLRSVTNYLNGKLHGVQKYYFFTGQVKNQVEYCNGIKNGLTEKNSIEGDLLFQCFFVDGKMNGTCFEYEDNSFVWSNYFMGQLHGVRWEDNMGTKLLKSTSYVNGKKNGDSKVYAYDGTLLQHFKYKDDKLEGEFIEYSKDLVHSMGHFKDGLKDGEFTTFYPDGKIHIQSKFKNNKQVEWKSFDENGKVKPEVKTRH